jgi:hypothetical protein
MKTLPFVRVSAQEGEGAADGKLAERSTDQVRRAEGLMKNVPKPFTTCLP